MVNLTKVAVVGVGRWGVHWLRNILEHSQAELAAVIDPNPERLETVKRQYKLSDEILLTTDWQAIQQISGLTAVIIATPATTHYQLIRDALNWGYHVLAEKPLTLDAGECQELCELAQQQQLVLMVDHTYLFHPAVERGKQIMESGDLGDLRYGYATRSHLCPVRQDVDALWDLAIHDIAIFNTWLQEIPVKVQATGMTWLQPGLADVVWAVLTYPSGFQATIHLSWLNNDKQRRLVVAGSRGSLVFDEMSAISPLMLLRGELQQQDGQFIPTNQSQQVLEIEKSEPLRTVCDRFLASITANTANVVSSGWVGKDLVEVLSALTRSLQQGGMPISVGQPRSNGS
ncbi:Gfo/Idh/MocA family protein [Calothrix sp. PCC 6303]|uniref:Gfo/Idh/MocA family protein n=1 Tax=Calothrix sp. PCC 6303 TaxID=1170562 RepID=UPI0002A02EAF|nr:Gfo/Idh/MocA family oxidoreductase [Calothrix sp. PCC 6303]AFZ00722.1 oxidoreductase domain protein [Calothrix sp. PCC 6303]